MGDALPRCARCDGAIASAENRRTIRHKAYHAACTQCLVCSETARGWDGNGDPLCAVADEVGTQSCRERRQQELTGGYRRLIESYKTGANGENANAGMASRQASCVFEQRMFDPDREECRKRMAGLGLKRRTMYQLRQERLTEMRAAAAEAAATAGTDAGVGAAAEARVATAAAAAGDRSARTQAMFAVAAGNRVDERLSLRSQIHRWAQEARAARERGSTEDRADAKRLRGMARKGLAKLAALNRVEPGS
jgi:hypothetical protein